MRATSIRRPKTRTPRSLDGDSVQGLAASCWAGAIRALEHDWYMRARGAVFYIALIACGGISSGQSYAFHSEADASGFGTSDCDVVLSHGSASAHFLAPAPLAKGSVDANPKPALPEQPAVCGASSQSIVDCTTINGPSFSKGSAGCVRSDRCLRVILEGSDASDLRNYLGIDNDGKYLLTVKCGEEILVDSVVQTAAVVTSP
jgi:hypothetical protein